MTLFEIRDSVQKHNRQDQLKLEREYRTLRYLICGDVPDEQFKNHVKMFVYDEIPQSRVNVIGSFDYNEFVRIVHYHNERRLVQSEITGRLVPATVTVRTEWIL